MQPTTSKLAQALEKLTSRLKSRKGERQQKNADSMGTDARKRRGLKKPGKKKGW